MIVLDQIWIMPLRILLFFYLFNFHPAYSQNMVVNGSFEEFKRCPENKKGKKYPLTNIKCIQGRPGIYNRCNDEFDLYQNITGKQSPQEGSGYIGMTITDDSFRDCQIREFIQLPLRSPLIAGYKYEVSFHVSLADRSGYYSDQFGACFSSEDRSKTKIVSDFIGRADISNKESNYLNDTINWVEIKGVYNAKGGEKYILLGNFQRCNFTTRIAVTKNKDENVLRNLKRTYSIKLDSIKGNKNYESIAEIADQAYYYLDNISVVNIGEQQKINYLTSEKSCDKNYTYNLSTNLIIDPGFNFNTDSLKRSWFNPGIGTPDFYNGSTGIYLFSGVDKNNREYVITKLKEPVTPCNKYYYSMKIRRDPTYKFSVDQIGIGFTDNNHFQNNRDLLPIAPAYTSPSGYIIDNTEQWITLCGEFSFNDCAKYMVVGNLKNDDETYVIPSESSTGQGPYAYYIIDDIFLTKLDTVPGCEIKCDTLKFEEKSGNPEKVQEVENLTFPDTLTIRFSTGSYQFNKPDDKLIFKLKELLEGNPGAKLLVAGYADNTGNAEMNQKLSEKRAMEVYNYLLREGIRKENLSYNFFGSMNPLVDNINEKNRSLNRRVEILLVRP